MGVVFTVPAVFKAVNQISRPMKQMGASVKWFARSAGADIKRLSMTFNRLNNRVNRVAGKIKKSLGTIGVAFGMFALISVVGNAVNVFADFEQANAGLAAVMNRTVGENKALTKDAMRLGSVTARTASEVVGLQESFARLGFQEKSILNMTQSTISGSIAMRAELADTADLVGAVVKTFDAFSSVDAPMIIDQMTLATQKSALNFEKLQTSIPIVAGAASAAGVPFTKLLALLGKLSDSGIDASSSANALKRIFIESKAKGEDYEQILGRIVKNSDKLTASVDQFGVRASVSSVILSKNIKNTQDLDKALQGAAGTAETAANKQLNTLNGRLTILGSAWEGFILSVESGDGVFAKFLKTSVEVATEFLSMASGTAKAKDQLTETELKIRSLALKVKNFVSIAGSLIKTYIIFVAVQKSLNIAVKAYQLLMRVGHFFKFVRVFIKLARAKGFATAAQKLLNLAVLSNPYIAMGVAIAAVIGIIYKMVTAQSASEKAMEEVNNRTRELAAQQIVDLNKQFSAIKKTLPLSKERITLINQLKNAYPGVNDAMEKELKNTNNLTQSYDFLRAAIIKTAKAKAVQEKIGDQANKLVDFELQLQQMGIKSEDFMKDFKNSQIVEQNIIGQWEVPLSKLPDYYNLLKKYRIDEGIFDNMALIKDAANAAEIQTTLNDLIKLNENLQQPTQAFVKNSALDAGNITNNFNTYDGNGVLTSDNNSNNNPQQNTNRVDLFINNRAGNTETTTEGTGVNVDKTGY